MRDVVYLIINGNRADRLVHCLESTSLTHDERPLKLVLNIPNSYFVPRPLPALELSVPEQDMLTAAELEVAATLIPEQEQA